jgi:hypothetical protein
MTKDCATQRIGIERPRYFPRQLVTADDLTLEQDYFRNRLRRHNRMLHGYGVVCGATLKAAAEPWKVIVSRGYLLGPYGDEIAIEREICFDVRTRCKQSTSDEPCPPPTDPWCSEPIEPLVENKPVFIAVRYVELPRRPVRVSPAGCGCETSACEYSRWQDGYEICSLEECPSPEVEEPNFEVLRTGEPPSCPECPTEPWVVLGSATPDKDGKITIGLCDCRRQVLAFGRYWWKCEHSD